MLDFFNNIYLGNFLINWFYFFTTIIFFLFFAKITCFLSKKFIVGKKIYNIEFEKVINSVEEPFTFLLIIFGIFIGYHFLVLESIFDFYFFNIIKFLLIIGGTWFLIKSVDIVLKNILNPYIEKKHSRYNTQIIKLLEKLLKIFIIIFSFIIILDNFGFDVFTLVAGIGVGGIAFAFAAQKTLSDAFGGLSIFISKPFIIGDTIEFDNNIGAVEEISLRHTKIRNLDKRLVIVPNSTLSSAIIINITSGTKRKIIWKIGLTYDTSIKKIEKAKKIIKKAIEESDFCEKEPVVAFEEFADFSLNILVVFFTKENTWIDSVKAKDEIGLKIKKEFEKNNIEFAFPTQTIHLKK